MRRTRGLGQWLGLALVFVLFAVPATVSGATSVRVVASHSAAFRVVPAAAPPVVIGAHALVHFGFAAPGYPAAGVQGNTPGLQGTTVVLPACAAACTDRYRPASSAAIPARDYAERVIFTVTQPPRAGPAVGFDVEVGVHLATGWVFGAGYFSTGVATGAAAATITLRFYVDLGAALPTVTAVETVVNSCSSTTGCP